MNDLATDQLNEANASRLDVMNFLNEVAGNFPQAISFASGRPAEQFFLVEQWLRKIDDYVGYFADRSAMSRSKAFNLVAQYGRTNGIINDLIARQIARDDGIACSGDQIVTTAGCQEAIALCLNVLCTGVDDVIVVRSPTYIGITGAAQLHRIPLAPVVCDNPDDFPAALAEEIELLRARGKRPRALYIVADFDNPTGTVLSRQSRELLLDYCAANDIVILEDNPYGMFCYDGERLPPLAALDRHGCTLYLGTYSKTLCPAVRVGFIVVPKQLLGGTLRARKLIDRLSIIKSFVTCNTSQLMQALVGGILLHEDCSLANIVRPALAHYRNNREAMLAALRDSLTEYRDLISWNRPAGGFFLTVNLPFDFGQAEVAKCASSYRVIAMPLSFFALTDDHDRSVRLAFSNLSPEEIGTGVGRFSEFVKKQFQKGP